MQLPASVLHLTYTVIDIDSKMSKSTRPGTTGQLDLLVKMGLLKDRKVAPN